MTTRLALTYFILATSLHADWKLQDDANQEMPGRKVDITQDGALRARLIYGEGQMKPYLQVFGENGDCLNKWDEKQVYPHHRGIFIGWNKISSDLSKQPVDLWHLNNGGKMELVKLEKLEGDKDRATLVATIAWRGNAKDAAGSDLILTETRTLVVSRPGDAVTQVDATFALTAERDCTLAGDLQHAGIHFRASKEVGDRKGETSYVWEPDAPGKDGKVASKSMKWVRLTFPIGERFYHATQLNSPGNPVDELSWRDYGRFGFFFTSALKKGESLVVKYRFVTEIAKDMKAKPTAQQSAALRQDAQALYDQFAGSLKK